MRTLEGLHDLIAHPNTPALFDRVTAQVIEFDSDSIMIEWGVLPSNALFCPTEPSGGRHDGLWQTTCFEAFFQPNGHSAYVEYNFSPSLAWAAYRFDGHRSRMKPLAVRLEPEIITYSSPYHLSATFGLPLSRIGGALGLSAVLQDRLGAKSYWALRHPPGAPDFHHPDCFALELPPSDAP